MHAFNSRIDLQLEKYLKVYVRFQMMVEIQPFLLINILFFISIR